jgi:hypothetical protein
MNKIVYNDTSSTSNKVSVRVYSQGQVISGYNSKQVSLNGLSYDDLKEANQLLKIRTNFMSKEDLTKLVDHFETVVLVERLSGAKVLDELSDLVENLKSELSLRFMDNLLTEER